MFEVMEALSRGLRPIVRGAVGLDTRSVPVGDIRLIEVRIAPSVSVEPLDWFLTVHADTLGVIRLLTARVPF